MNYPIRFISFTILLISTFVLTETALSDSTLSESQNQLIKLTDKGIEPLHLEMRLEDSIVFFLNSSTDSLTTLEVEYNGKQTHCATSNLKIDENKRASSVRPFGPRDFASVCFHEKGDYPVTVYGLRPNSKGIKALVTVR